MSLLRLFRYLVEQTSGSAVSPTSRSFKGVKPCAGPKSGSETPHTADPEAGATAEPADCLEVPASVEPAGRIQCPADNSLDSFEALDPTPAL